MKVKVVFNACYGGFSLSLAATEWLAARGCQEAIDCLAAESSFWIFEGEREFYGFRRICRHSSLLVECVETLGEAANGSAASLEIKEISGDRYRIEEYDGAEGVVEPDDLKWITV